MEWININGTNLEVRRIEAAGAAADRAPLVFLHEGLGSVAMWRDWPDQLCAATGRAGRGDLAPRLWALRRDS
jgi:pimeloyl-ACP methyl ester carboxylesterase